MPGFGIIERALTNHLDEIFVYDGSLAGFLCCVFESAQAGGSPIGILPVSADLPLLFSARLIATDPEKARRVYRGIQRKLSNRAVELLGHIFLSCLPNKERLLLRFFLRGFSEGRQLVYRLGDADVSHLLSAERHLLHETHLLTGFVRFADTGQGLVSCITPKNFVLPLLAPHFADRFAEENFLIFDKTHKAAFLYQNRKGTFLEETEIDFPEASEAEQQYRALWKTFYNTIAIEARRNERCRMGHMPKRYWENMPELL